MVNTAGHYDFVKRGSFFPAVVTIGLLGVYVFVFAIALSNYAVINSAGAFGQGFDNFDGPYFVSNVTQNSGLVARTSPDFQYFVRFFDIQNAGHAAHRVWARNSYTKTNIQKVIVIGMSKRNFAYKLFPWC